MDRYPQNKHFKVCVSYLPNTVVNIITSREGICVTLRVNLSEYIQSKCLTFRQHSSTVPPCILLPPGFDSLNHSSILYFRQVARNKALENKMKHEFQNQNNILNYRNLTMYSHTKHSRFKQDQGKTF